MDTRDVAISLLSRGPKPAARTRGATRGGIRAVAMWAAVVGASASGAIANDWPYWRGPEQTGMSREIAGRRTNDADRDERSRVRHHAGGVGRVFG